MRAIHIRTPPVEAGLTELNKRSGSAAVIADRVQKDALLGYPLKPTSLWRPDSVRGKGLCCCKREEDQEQAHREVGQIITGIVFDEPLMSAAKLPLMSFLLPNMAFSLRAAIQEPAGEVVPFQTGCV